jgi:hypothetical protein
MKINNDYAIAAGRDFYAEIPKAVWAALAVSSLTQGGDYLDEARARVAAEWQALYQAGIVPQRPNKEALAALPKEGEG